MKLQAPLGDQDFVQHLWLINVAPYNPQADKFCSYAEIQKDT